MPKLGSPDNPHLSSEHEGLIVQSAGHTFRIVDGRRIWLSPVPYETLREILDNPSLPNHD